MSVFSYCFFIFWGLSLIFYYLSARGRYQWVILLAASLIFYTFSIEKMPVILVAVSIVTYVCGRFIDTHRDADGNPKGSAKIFYYVSIGICIGLLVLGRTTSIFALLGNSYFTLKAVGYLIDVKREKPAVRNFLKYLLYLIFFPTISEGPINRIQNFLEIFDKPVYLESRNFYFGIQRFLFGACKKLVVAERLGQFAGYVFGSLSGQGGATIIVAAAAYAIQIYADFSGYMDMMLGVGITFGITLPENFKQPYFARNIPEFWRRWHITLGQWFKDYVMFSFMMSRFGRSLGKWAKKYGKRWRKLAPEIVGTTLVWICTGLWHNMSMAYLAWGAYYAVLMIVSLIVSPGIQEWMQNRKINVNGKIYTVFCVVRTWFLVLCADIVVRVDRLSDLKIVVHEICENFRRNQPLSLAEIGWGRRDAAALVFVLCIMMIASLLQEKGRNVYEVIAARPLVIRWVVYYSVLFATLLFGLYGASYDASQFLYMQF